MKYRTRKQLIRIALLCIFLVSSFEFMLSLMLVEKENVINQKVIFTLLPPKRVTERLQVGTKSNVFKKVNNWKNTSLGKKLQRWENEYMFRSVNEHLKTKKGIYDILKKHAKRGAVWVDSGGHVGDTSIPVLTKLWDNGRYDTKLVIVEPDKSKCLWIKRNLIDLNSTEYTGIFEMVTLVNSGLWSHATRASIERDKMHPGGWSVQPDEIRLRNRSLDAICPLHSANRPWAVTTTLTHHWQSGRRRLV